MLIAYDTYPLALWGKDSSAKEIRQMEDWNQRAVDARLETPRVWQLTNKRVSTRNGAPVSLPFFDNDNHRFETKRRSFAAIASVADDALSTATRYRKCESSVMGNWSEQTRIEDFVKRGNIVRVVIIVSFSAIVPQILRDAYLKFRCREPEGKRASMVFELFATIAILTLSCNAHPCLVIDTLASLRSNFHIPRITPSISPLKYVLR